MTQLKQFPLPDLTDVLNLARDDFRRVFNAVNIGIIEAFDASDQTVSVRLAIKRIQNIAPDGTRFYTETPVLLKCPTHFPSGGGFTMTFPISQGDECIVLFNDREIDNWFNSGGVQAPTSLRMHDISDALAIVGIRSKPRSLSGVSTNSAQLRSDDGSTYVEVASGGIVRIVADEVIIEATTRMTIDTPELEVTGDALINDISFLQHVHDGVTVGSGNTGEPVP